MKVEVQHKLRFSGVDIVDVKFNTFKPVDNKAVLNFDIIPKVFYPQDNPRALKIVFELTLFAEEYFNLQVAAIGLFEFEAEIEDKQRRTLANLNAPAIMFPYIRSFISTFTSNLGNVTGHILLPTQFFDGELEEIVISDPNVKHH